MINQDLDIKVAKNNNSIVKSSRKCINCGYCKKVCKNDVIGNDIDKIEQACINCGLCTNICPTESIHERLHYRKVSYLLHHKMDKIIIFNLFPSSALSSRECFDLKDDFDITGKIIASLKNLGSDYVFNAAVGYDINIMETSNELLKHLGKKMPLFTSSCPAWIKYCEMFYSKILPHLSTTKSANMISGMLTKNYIANKLNISDKKIVNIMVSPCTAYKLELINNKDIDYVLTTRELAMLLKEENIDVTKFKSANFDLPFKNGSYGTIISETSGGYAEAILKNTFLNDEIDYSTLRGMNGIKEIKMTINNRDIKIAVCNGMKNAINLVNKILNKEVSYDLVEVMVCPGGCICGGGQPKITILNMVDTKNVRIESLNKLSEKQKIEFSYQNKKVIDFYNDVDKKKYHCKHIDKSYLLGGKDNG